MVSWASRFSPRSSHHQTHWCASDQQQAMLRSMLLLIGRILFSIKSRNAVLVACYGWFLCYLIGVPFGGLGPIQGVALPTLVAATAVSLAGSENNAPIPFAQRKWWIATALFPFFIRIVLHVGYRIQTSDSKLQFEKVIALLLNTSAKVAVMVMGPLLVVAPSPSQVWLHAALGVFVVIVGCGHGIGYLGGFVWLRGNLRRLLLPPLACWDPSNTVESMDCGGEYDHCSCYSIMVNFYGVLSLCGMGLLGISSLPYFRRKIYTIFYNIHVFTSPMIVLMLCLHYKRTMMYMSGGIAVYAAQRLPEMVEHWVRQQRHRAQQPVRIMGMDVIPCRDSQNGCLVLTVATAASPPPSAGHHVRLLVPSISRVSHPFSVITTSDRPGQLRLLIRCCGSFTRQLVTDLSSSPHRTPLYLQGYYSSSGASLHSLASLHDSIVCIVGGIGITAVLGWIAEQPTSSTPIVLHWACRDPVLVSYVLETWFTPTGSPTRCVVRIVVHHTGGVFEKSSTSVAAAVERSIDCSVAALGQPWTPTTSSSRPTIAALVWIGWMGLLAAVVAYELLQVRHDLRSRLWSPALTLVWVLAATALLRLCSCRRGLWISKAKESGVVHDDDTEGEALWVNKHAIADVETVGSEEFELGPIRQRHSTDAPQDPNPNTRMDVPKVGVEHREGRPTMGEMLEDVPPGKTKVGIVVCGPASLTYYVRKNLPCQNCKGSRATRFTLYEESFAP